MTLVLAGLVILGTLSDTASATVSADAWATTQLTDNSYEDTDPEVSGDRVAWRGYGDSHWDIFTWKAGDSSPTNLSNSIWSEVRHQISGDRVVWEGYDGSDWEIFTWAEGDSSPTNLTDNSGLDAYPQVSGDRVVWWSDYDIYTWKVGDSSPTMISDDGQDDYNPVQVSGDRVVWPGWDGHDVEIYTWKVGDSSPTQISDDLYTDESPQVSGDRVVWERYDGHDNEIYTWKVGDSSPTQLTDNVSADDDPQVSGDRVVWWGYDGSDYEIFTWRAGDTSPTPITDNAYDDWLPQVSGDRVVWQGQNGSDWEIFTWQAGDTSPTPITDNAYDDWLPQVSGDRMVWYGGTSEADHEIFTAVLPPLVRYQQGDTKITYLGDWSTSSTWSASGGSYAATDQPGATAIATFTGVEVIVVSPTAPSYGEAKIYIDGVFEGTVDLYSPSASWKIPVYSSDSLAPGFHTVAVECAGTKNPSSSGISVALDALDIRGDLEQAGAATKVDDKDSSCIYVPDWSHWDNTGYWAAYQDTYAFTDKDGDQMSFTFEGTFASWVAATSNTKGKAEVRLYDGTVDPGNLVSTTTVDLYSPSTLWKQNVYSTGLLENGVHTVVIECLYEKNPASWWYTVDVDRFDILGTPTVGNPPSLVPQTFQQDDSKITYLGGGWSTTYNPSASGVSYISTSQPLAAAWVEFVGTEVTLVFRTAPSYGIAKVTLDPDTPDEETELVDLYSATAEWQVDSLYAKTGLDDATHTLVVECLGLTNASSTGIAITLDAVEILGYLQQAPTVTKVDDKDASCVYGPPDWSHWDYSGYWAAYLDTYAFTDQDDYEMSFTFEGTFASWVAATSNTKGKAEVRLYAGSVAPGNLLNTSMVDLYSPITLWKRSVYSTGLLEDGVYVVVIECLYEKNPASWWYTVDVDRFDILGSVF